MSYHAIELTYPEIKYLLEYLSDEQAKQCYLNNCLEDNTLEYISKRLAYLRNVEEALIEVIKILQTEKKQYGSLKFNRNYSHPNVK